MTYTEPARRAALIAGALSTRDTKEGEGMSDNTPSPGSKEARRKGCKYPVIDNGHGAGYLGGMTDDDGNVVFVMVEDCPLHGSPSTQPEKGGTRG